jgi:hypothetical protein
MNGSSQLTDDARSVVAHGVQIRTLEDRMRSVEEKLDRVFWAVLTGAAAAIANFVADHLTK